MSVGEELLMLVVGGCLGLLITVAVVAGVVWLSVVIYRDRRRAQRNRWTQIADALGLRIEAPLPSGRLEGEVDGLSIVVEERLVNFVTTQDVVLGVAALALGADAGSSAVPVTFVRSELRPALSRAVSFVHTGSGRPLSSASSDRDLAGHANPLADSVHRVRSADAGWAASWLAQLAERGGVADLELDGWRASFTETEVLLERTARATEHTVREGIARASRLIARLRVEGGYR